MISSQDHKPGTHETPNQIAKYTGISRASVMRIVKEDLQLQPFQAELFQQFTETSYVQPLLGNSFNHF